MPLATRSARTGALWLVCLALPALLAGSTAAAAEPTKAECIAANEGAQDLRGAGRLLEARTQLATCMMQSCPGPIRQDCGQRLADIEKALPTLVLIARDSAGNDVGGVHVSIDGKAVAQELNGTALPLDPGEHRIALDATGLPRAEKTLVLHEGEKARREVIVFPAAAQAAHGAQPAEASKPPAVDTASPESGGHDTSSVAPPPPPAASSDDRVPPGHTQRLVGVGLGGLGLVGVVVGSIFGILADSTYQSGAKACGSVTACKSPSGASDVQSGYDQATIANVGFIAGGVLLGAGAAVYFTAPKAGGAVAISPSLGDRSAGLTMRGAW